MRFPSILGSKLGRSPRTRRQNVLFIAVCILVSVILIAISVSASFGTVDRGDRERNPSPQKGIVNVDVDLISLDPATGNLVVDIQPWYDDDQDTLYKNCDKVPHNRTFWIYQDQNLLVPGPDSEAIPHTNTSDTPAFRIAYDPCDQTFWRHNTPTWRQTLKLFLDQVDPQNNGSRGYGSIGNGLQAYPFDKYYATLFLFAEQELPGGNESITIQVSSVTGVVANFETTKEPWYYGLDDNGVINLVEELPETGQFDLVLQFSVDRSISVKAFCMVIVVTNWIVSLVFLWITIACIIWKEKVVKELFAIPIATLFAFSAVRGSMPGAPAGFGAFIDYVGILPNFAILTVCSFVLIILILVERIKERDSEEGSEANSDDTPEKIQMPQPTVMY